MTGLLAALTDVGPVYEIPDDDLIGEVLVPAMSHADEVWVGSGYFSSHCLAQVAAGLADFIERSEAPLKLLLSPEISPDDRAAIKKGVTTEQDLVDRLAEEIFEGGTLSESALVEHTRECFAYLIAIQRLELRFVLMEGGIYHKKQWLIREGDAWMAVHGSGNATSRGLLVNGEQMTVDRAWSDGAAAEQTGGEACCSVAEAVGGRTPALAHVERLSRSPIRGSRLQARPSPNSGRLLGSVAAGSRRRP